MPDYEFVTLDVFTTQRFGGNPLAVLPDARGLDTAQMQAVAREFNYSETTFVLPPDDPAHDARVRIFTPRYELPFAGHPNVGTGFVLMDRRGRDRLVFEELAGLVTVERDAAGVRIAAPQPFSAGPAIDPGLVAASACLPADDLDNAAHPPVLGSCGTPFILARVRPDALARAAYDPAAFAAAASSHPALGGRFALHLYVPGDTIRTRMFAPLGGTTEDPATGSANVALAGLLLSLSDDAEASYAITQGVEMGRPSELHARAWRRGADIMTSVAGACVKVMRGTITL